MKSLVAIVAAAALVPAAVRAEEWREDQGGDGYPDDRAGYDVSVDVNGSGAATFETFQAPLSSYGEWVSVAGYGAVWRPRVAVGWRPYYYGRWEWTNEGWLWVSDEPYGWAVYHYGRWAHDPYYGWIWVPGYEWAPAWVSWRYSGDVVGWAPLAPGLSVYVSTYPFVDFWWTFVPTVRFVSTPIYTVAYAPSYTRQWYYRSAPAPARAAPAPAPGVRAAPAPAWGGPAPRLVAERIGRPLTPARIVQAPSPGARARPGEISVYRPGPAAPAAAPAFRGGPAAAPAPAFRGSAPPPRSDVGRGPAPAPTWRGGGVARPAEPMRAPQPAAPPPAFRPEPRREAAPAPAPQRRGGGRGESREHEGQHHR